MSSTQVKTELLKPYANNSRQHSDDQIQQIVRSIQTFGFTNPILCDEQYNIIAGHGRLMAAKVMKLEEVPVRILAGLSDEQKKAYVIADNKIALNSTWNTDVLKAEITELKDKYKLDLSLLGFSDIELNEILAYKDDGSLDEAPAPEENPVSKMGEIFQLGRHKLLVGDATKLEDAKKLMGDEKSDLILTDPPYGVCYKGSVGSERSGIANDDLQNEELYEFLKKANDNYYATCNEGAPIYVFHADAQVVAFVNAFNKAKFKLHQLLYWIKDRPNLTRMDYQPGTEPCIAGQAGEKDIYTDDSDFNTIEERLIYGWKEGKRHNWFNGRKEKNILRWKKPDRSPEHPTMKPIGMMKYLIRNSSRRNALVVDFFGGSGSTLIAAEETGRRCNTIEFDPKYADVIRKRYTKLAKSKGMSQEQIGNGYLE